MTMVCRTRVAARFLLGTIIAIFAALGAEVAAQPCNPAIDGTYCAEQMSRKPSGTMATPPSNPSLGGDFFSIVRENDPATLGAITFSGGTRCIGLLRRSSCN